MAPQFYSRIIAMKNLLQLHEEKVEELMVFLSDKVFLFLEDKELWDTKQLLKTIVEEWIMSSLKTLALNSATQNL